MFSLAFFLKIRGTSITKRILHGCIFHKLTVSFIIHYSRSIIFIHLFVFEYTHFPSSVYSLFHFLICVAHIYLGANSYVQINNQ